jgi:hypothetical protein
MRDLQKYAIDALAEAVTDACKGFTTIDDATSEIEDQESKFDGDSYCPYYRQQVDVIADYESDFGNDATELTGDATYKAEDWQQAQTAYAYTIALVAHDFYFYTAKQELIDGLEEFGSDAVSELELDDTPQVKLSMTCIHGWASHDRELSDGTMVFESRQLDGCNGMERQIGGLWVSCCVDPSKKEEGTADEEA